MAERTVVHLLRHGEVYNPHHVLYGRLPGYHLSDSGRWMADAAANYFSERDVTALFASPLERAQETAQPTAQRRHERRRRRDAGTMARARGGLRLGLLGCAHSASLNSCATAALSGWPVADS